MTADWKSLIREKHADAALERKQGDRSIRHGDSDIARTAFLAGTKLLDEAIQVLLTHASAALRQAVDAHYRGLQLDVQWPQHLEGDDEHIAVELAETFGARGGFQRRLNDREAALANYSTGAELELRYVRSSTYNRVNAVKYGLLTGLKTLADSKPALENLERTLAKALDQDEILSDSGWAWADLADCRALLGNIDGAALAYRSFIEKASTKAPQVALDILRQVVGKLKEAKDPQVDTVEASLKRLEVRIG